MEKEDNKEKLVKLVDYYYDHPKEFMVDLIGINPTFQQEQVLDKLNDCIAKGKGIAVKSGHGTGKTCISAGIIIWFMTTRAHPKIICTAPSKAQLYDVLWSELTKWLQQFKFKSLFNWTKTTLFNINHQETWFAAARTSNKPESMAGIHGKAVMYIVDESSGVDDEVFEVLEGGQTEAGSILLMFSNPTRITGAFHDAFTIKRKFFECFTFNAEKSPRVTASYCKKIAAKYGKDSDVYRVRVLGEFPKSEPDTFITLDKVERAVNRDLEQEDKDISVAEFGIDVARFGSDESVVFSRVGWRYEEELVLKKNDTVELSNKVARIALDRFSDKTTFIFNVDDSGVGGGVTDNLRRMKREDVFGEKNVLINAVNNGGRVRHKRKYSNVTSEMWSFVRDNIDEMKLPNSSDLTAQLSVRKYTIDSKARINLEKKDEMKRRGISSPDRADAFVLASTSMIYSTTILSNLKDVKITTRDEVKELVNEFSNSSLKDRMKFYKKK